MDAAGAGEVGKQIEQLVFRLEEQGCLDAQFQRILQLPDESNPNFVSEVVELFLANTEKHLTQIRAHLVKDQPDFEAVSNLLILMKGSNDTFGARALTGLCVRFQEACAKGLVADCKALLEGQERELGTLKKEMGTFLELYRKKTALLGRGPG
ncbi:unnamed protein product [Ostreobium quekettii]|uniref:Histidine-containing phosphotransfer protein n=1 Tax=Ostreobium quekettii TaxID=121088 RepID=A0A8S1IRT7_9CHLO|nr:unnamed protein product [Ostreobium quekettii]|eukprot:evm.model.scf_119EXC.4 EVM.evm.TU.scf_119EXC.4   scf_119EXC:21459-21917(+)